MVFPLSILNMTKKPATPDSTSKPGPKAQAIRTDVDPANCAGLADFIRQIGPSRSVHRALGITNPTFQRRLQEPATLTLGELARLATISGTTMEELLQLARPELDKASDQVEE